MILCMISCCCYGASDSDRRPIAGPRTEPLIRTVNGNVVVELLTAVLQEPRWKRNPDAIKAEDWEVKSFDLEMDCVTVSVFPSLSPSLPGDAWHRAIFFEKFKEHLLARIRNRHDLACHLIVSCQQYV